MGKKKAARILLPVVKQLSSLGDTSSINFYYGENRYNHIVMPYYSSTPAVNVIQNTYAQYPPHVTSINLPKIVPQHFAYPPNTLLWVAWQYSRKQIHFFIFSSFWWKGCGLLRMLPSSQDNFTLGGRGGGKAYPNPLFDLVLIAKLHRKMERSECRRKKEIFISMLLTMHYNLLPVQSQN